MLANRSSYTGTGIEQALRISFRDQHEKERHRATEDRSPRKKGHGKGKRSYAHAVDDYEPWAVDWDEEDEDQDYANEAYEQVTEESAWQDDEDKPTSDQGVSNDEEINEAYAAMDQFRKTYRDQRKKLKDLQKARGFFRGEFTVEERAKAIEQEKARSRCGTCGRVGHWSGDAACPKSSSKPGKAKGKGKTKGKKPGSANVVSSTPFPTYYTLTQDDMDAHADMLHAEREQDEEANGMPMDGGDDGRRRRVPEPRIAGTSSWSEVSPGENYAGEIVIGGVPCRPVSSLPSAGEVEALRASNVKVHPVALSAEERVKPNLNLMRVGPLRELCITNEIAYSNLNKEQLVESLAKFYDGQVVPKRGSGG